MHRWVRIYGDQYLGFWILGLLLFAVQEIPYLLMPLLRLETNPIMNMTETSPILDACEKLFGAVYTMCLRFDIISSSAFINKLLSAAIQARICIMEIANANVLFGFVKKSMPMTRRANASKNREMGVYAFLSIVESPSFY